MQFGFVACSNWLHINTSDDLTSLVTMSPKPDVSVAHFASSPLPWLRVCLATPGHQTIVTHPNYYLDILTVLIIHATEY